MLPATMRRLRDRLKCAQHADGNPWDDGPLPDLTSGLMWSATGLFGAAVLGKLRQPLLSVRGVP